MCGVRATHFSILLYRVFSTLSGKKRTMGTRSQINPGFRHFNIIPDRLWDGRKINAMIINKPLFEENSL